MPRLLSSFFGKQTPSDIQRSESVPHAAFRLHIRAVPYSEEEAAEAWIWVNRHGPSNAWTGTGGTAARMIGRLLKERERLLKELQEHRPKGSA